MLSTPPAPVTRVDRPRPAYVSAVRVAAVEPTETTVTLPPARIPMADGQTTRNSAATQTSTPSTMRWVKGADGKSAKTKLDAKTDKADVKIEKKGRTVIAKVKDEPAKPERQEAKSGKTGWMIQIGATDDSAKANALLARAKSKSRAVASAHAVTEKVQKGKETLWRARFAGLQESAAETACKDLKRSGFACFAMKN